MTEWTMVEFNKCLAALKLSQADVALKCGVKQATVSRWCNGQTVIPPEALAIMQHAASDTLAAAQQEQARKHSKEQQASAQGTPPGASAIGHKQNTSRCSVWQLPMVYG